MSVKTVVLLSGKIGSGKNTFGEMLQEILGYRAKTDYFARPLKEMCRDAFRPLSLYLNSNLSIDTIEDSSWFEKKTPVTRHILQIVGTDIVRKVSENYWSKMARDNISSHLAPIVIMTDWRFPSEWDFLDRTMNCVCVRINRGIGREKEHESETALDNFEWFDFIIENNSTLEDLRIQANLVADYIIEGQMP